MTVQAFSRVHPYRLSIRSSPREFPGALHLQLWSRGSAHDWLLHTRAARALAHHRLRALPRCGTLSQRSPSPSEVQSQLEGRYDMNRAEFISHVAAETSTTKVTAERMVKAVLSAITASLARDDPVAIAGFGKFAIRDRAARQGRNPRTGESVAVPASKMTSFKPAKAHRVKIHETSMRTSSVALFCILTAGLVVHAPSIARDPDQSFLCRDYLEDLNITSSETTSELSNLCQEATTGNGDSALALGLKFATGSDDITPDYRRASEWFKRSAELKNPKGAFNLGCSMLKDSESRKAKLRPHVCLASPQKVAYPMHSTTSVSDIRAV